MKISDMLYQAAPDLWDEAAWCKRRRNQPRRQAALLGKIFRKCAEYENRLWDALYA
jgi:hypothetical protein